MFGLFVGEVAAFGQAALDLDGTRAWRVGRVGEGVVSGYWPAACSYEALFALAHGPERPFRRRRFISFFQRLSDDPLSAAGSPLSMFFTDRSSSKSGQWMP